MSKEDLPENRIEFEFTDTNDDVSSNVSIPTDYYDRKRFDVIAAAVKRGLIELTHKDKQFKNLKIKEIKKQ